MAFRLIPREEKFYQDFLAIADELKKGAKLLEEMLEREPPEFDKAEEIKEIEHKCDFLSHEVYQRLHRTFVTPLDREDIHALARSLDDVMDTIDATAGYVRLYKVEQVRYGAREMARIISESHRRCCDWRWRASRRARVSASTWWRSTGWRTRRTACTWKPSSACSRRRRTRS